MIRESVKKMKEKGYRLITITAVDWGDTFELIYHFAKGNEIKNLRFVVRKDAIVPSVQDIYPTAFMYEWELFEKLGVRFKGARRIFEA